MTVVSRRLSKQLIYGAVYSVAIIFIISGVYLFSRPEPTCFDGRKNQREENVDCGGPCQSCEIRFLKAVEVSNIRRVPADGNFLSFGAEIRNPNARFGAEKFAYEFVIYGPTGEKIASVRGSSFIYPSEIKYLVGQAEVDAEIVSGIEIKTGDFSWKELSEFPPPKIAKREIAVKAAGGRTEVSGVLISGETTLIKEVGVVGVLFDKNGAAAGFSRTEINDLKGFEERFFKITFPKNADFKNVDAGRTRIFVEAKR